MTQIAEYVEELPNISGAEAEVEATIQSAKGKTVFKDAGGIDFKSIRSACAIALHMHQPLIPAGGSDLQTAELISNLQDMFNHPDIGDNHNASVFQWCYKRIGEFIPELVEQGKQPRAMLEYSGTLFHGLRKMGLNDVLEALQTITCNPSYQHCVEWLGMPWGHAVAPSTPVQDYRLHVKAFQQHFAAIFGPEALGRLRGFSPSEMALPNNPDIAYEFVKTLTECGYHWVIVQEHTVEQPKNGHSPERPHIPHRLVCRNSEGKEAEIIAIIKTQGSDTKLVAQMQPYYEAQGLSRVNLAGKEIPPLVTQIADGENGGVMMNEFPPKFKEVVQQCSGTDVPLMNVTEYLEHLYSMGIKTSDFPALQPAQQKKIWDRVKPGSGKKKVDKAIETLKKEDHQFNMDGGSWTNDISWVNGYENVLGPMEKASSAFNEHVLKPGVSPSDQRFRNALFNLLSSQTSCYRYWGQGTWTDYGREICRRAQQIVENDF